MVYDGQAIIKYGPDFAKAEVTKLSGIGKYPHLLVVSSGSPPPSSASYTSGENEALVSFGTIPAGQVAEKWVELHNLSPVRASSLNVIYASASLYECKKLS